MLEYSCCFGMVVLLATRDHPDRPLVERDAMERRYLDFHLPTPGDEAPSSSLTPVMFGYTDVATERPEFPGEGVDTKMHPHALPWEEAQAMALRLTAQPTPSVARRAWASAPEGGRWTWENGKLLTE